VTEQPAEEGGITSRELTYEEQREVLDALAFYADPETYFAIAFLPDRPCGPFEDDFEELTGPLAHPDGHPWTKPGRRAREVLFRLFPKETV
jgi:hypothetical protein